MFKYLLVVAIQIAIGYLFCYLRLLFCDDRSFITKLAKITFIRYKLIRKCDSNKIVITNDPEKLKEMQQEQDTKEVPNE